MLSPTAALLLFTIPVLAVPKDHKLGAMEISPRADYLGGWTQGRDGTGAGCPSTSVACDSGSYSQLNTQCCPSGQTCFATSIIAYCCPTCKSTSERIGNLYADSYSFRLQDKCSKLSSMRRGGIDYVFFTWRFLLL